MDSPTGGQVSNCNLVNYCYGECKEKDKDYKKKLNSVQI